MTTRLFAAIHTHFKGRIQEFQELTNVLQQDHLGNSMDWRR